MGNLSYLSFLMLWNPQGCFNSLKNCIRLGMPLNVQMVVYFGYLGHLWGWAELPDPFPIHIGVTNVNHVR